MVHGLLRRAVDAACTAVAMEVSSHALELRRVGEVRFGVAVFTNLSRDHLNFHADMESYRAAKARLFSGLGDGGVAIVNTRNILSRKQRRGIINAIFRPACNPVCSTNLMQQISRLL